MKVNWRKIPGAIANFIFIALLFLAVGGAMMLVFAGLPHGENPTGSVPLEVQEGESSGQKTIFTLTPDDEPQENYLDNKPKENYQDTSTGQYEYFHLPVPQINEEDKSRAQTLSQTLDKYIAYNNDPAHTKKEYEEWNCGDTSSNRPLDICGARPFICRSLKGDAEAEDALGQMLMTAGDNECLNREEGLKWLSKAAEAGHPGAMRHLAETMFYDQPAAAAKLARGPALSGDAIAQDDLGYLYEIGLGAKQSFSEAYFWFSLAEGRVGGDVRHGDFVDIFNVPLVAPPKVGEHKRESARHLTSEQKAEVDKRLREWKPVPFQPSSAASSASGP